MVLAIVSLMGLGTTTLVTNMLKLNKRTLAKSNLISVKDMIEKNLKNDLAWLRTTCGGNDPTPPPNGPGEACIPAPAPGNIGCLFDGDEVRCNQQQLVNPIIYNRNGEVVYNPGNANDGWTLEGEACNTYGTPDDDCPFRYTITVDLICPPTEDPCLKPDINITGTATISTATPSALANRVDPNDYLISYQRDQEVLYQPLQVAHTVTTNSINASCTPGVPQVRPLSSTVYDVGNNIITEDYANNRFQLQAGEYDCEVFATAFGAVGGFAIELQAGALPSVMVGSGYSANNSSTSVLGTAEINLSANSWVQVLHTCGPGSDQPLWPAGGQFQMGIPSPSYADGSTLTRVTCIRKR